MRQIYDKRAQALPKIITTIPVLFVIIFLMGIFLLVSGWIAKAGGEDARRPSAGVSGGGDELLIKELKQGGVSKGMTFFDAFVLSKASLSDVKNALIEDMKAQVDSGKYDTMCVILLKDSENENPLFDYDSITGKLSSNNGFFARFANDKHGFLDLNARSNAQYYSKKLTDYAFGQYDGYGKIKNIYVQVYYGEC